MKLYGFILLIGLLLAGTELSAEQELDVRIPAVFKKTQDYDVSYTVGDFQINTLHKVRIEGTVKLGGIQFLMISKGNKNANGFVKMDSVQSITPHGLMPAIKVFDQGRK